MTFNEHTAIHNEIHFEITPNKLPSYARRASLLLGLLAAVEVLAASEPSPLGALNIGTVETSHFVDGSCQFRLQDNNDGPDSSVVIETDFSVAWININGRNMGFEAEHKNDHATILRTPVGMIELVEVSPNALSDGSSQAPYLMKIHTSDTETVISVNLLASCR